METNIDLQILEAEERLRLAMLASDVAALDELLAPGLIFTNHCGQVLAKQDDLAAHLTGTLKVEELLPSELQIREVGAVVIVSVRAQIKGRYAGVRADADLRFTRVWAQADAGGWQVVAAHSSPVL